MKSVSYGRMVLPYPTTAADILNGKFMQKVDPKSLLTDEERAFYLASSRQVCRLASFCTTGPRTGHASDCPYKKGFANRPGFEAYRELKAAGKILGPK